MNYILIINSTVNARKGSTPGVHFSQKDMGMRLGRAGQMRGSLINVVVLLHIL